MNTSKYIKNIAVALLGHPAYTCASVSEVKVEVRRLAPSELNLVYRVHHEIDALLIPMTAHSSRTDELWKHTCAEVFIAAPKQKAYYEFNFSPSTQWAAYGFTDYRAGMQSIDCAAPLIEVTTTERDLRLEVRLSLPMPLANQALLEVGVTMVIEDTVGRCSYWAVSHEAPMPDFHCRDGFKLLV